MVDLELDGELAVITIDRPHARNAISLDTMNELGKALDNVGGASALVITGGGDKAFVSGGDLKELAALRTELEASEMAWRMRTICDRIAGFPGPVVAALNGHALGGGAEVAVSADIRIAADDIKIGFNQVSLAIMPAWGGAERLGALVGRSQALLLAGTGRILGAADAHRLGLIDEVVPRADFAAHWRTTAQLLARTPGPAIKRVINGTTTTDAVAAFAGLWVSDEHWVAADKVMNKGR
ncbi:enoyl-CoA hydratase/isomerase family protein [Mycolicibacterium diernhoferi]|uniref:Enoyl-CoA hydratase n=1 Tax=Mycolicibacterium diernhoferi TaxID=1801 RepID=A0A1Q4HKT9_9MYCO|nr:enoyl-CoA hydratase/isomerase family protein [Mycolicibacterium diernhoferi]OJZ68159.1 enoyl-CoA hydratase [Mycolicibacterium diernhoferi]OPE50738.1 enoyl-CoA hydratase [Mycolicibacterium diernhoferi]PEG53509.1 enoyl-CoA hydratase/isomerase family protein [Mycolicibacterium diernhoferi]QYL21355.1 enoyl-CoA hydratase/isomerase family protein [Mycolicibacterium diernhoferi]